jgi:hypothetical protein
LFCHFRKIDTKDGLSMRPEFDLEAAFSEALKHLQKLSPESAIFIHYGA